MTLTDYAIAGPPDMLGADFARVLAGANSPALAEWDTIYGALVDAGIRPAVWLAFGAHESQLGTVGIVAEYQTNNMGNVRSPEVPGAATIIATPRGQFARYATWTKGAVDWAARMKGPKYAGAGLTTVRRVLPRYAPPSDSNDTGAYIAAVLAAIGRYASPAPPTATKGPIIMSIKAPPIDTSHPSPNRGYSNAYKHKPEAVVWHITQGTDSLGWLTSPQSNASANYLIGRDGAIRELVPPDQSAWANGAVCSPDTSNPLIASWQATRGLNFNQRTISVEHEGLTSNNQGGSLTAAQVAATVALTAWLCDRFGIAPDQGHILGHYEIDNCNRHYCPGFSAAEWSSWVGQVAALVRQTPAPPPPLDQVVTERQEWGGQGQLVAEEVTVLNTETGAYYSRKKRYDAAGVVLEDWRAV